MENKKRLVNFDLLKVVSMLMIVCLHYLGKGGVLEKATLNDANYYVAWLFELMSIVGVNCFILCSGYLMTENRFRFSKLINMWLQIVFISLVCLPIGTYTGTYECSLYQIVVSFMPIVFREYWYMTSYFIFYALSPLLIWIVNKLSLSQLKKLVITLIAIFAIIPIRWTGINRGYHFIWFCILFFVAAYIRKAELFNKRVRNYIGLYALVVVVMFVIKLIIEMLEKKVDMSKYIDVCDYNFVLTFAASVLLFAAFKNLKLKAGRVGGFITFLSTLTLGVYLIHLNKAIEDLIWNCYIDARSFFEKPYFIFHMIICVLAVFFICAFFEYFRQLLFKLFGVPRFCEKLGAKVQSIADRAFNSNIIEKL